MRRLQLPRYRRYPVWNVGTIASVAVIVLVACGLTVLLAAEQPTVVELEVMLGAVAAMLFALLTVGLYRGARVRAGRFQMPDLRSDPGDLLQIDTGPSFEFDVGGGDDFGCLGIVLGLLMGVVMVLVLVAIAYLVLPVVYALVVLVAFSVWWLAYLALRRVFVLSRWCRGDAGRSVMYASLYTLVYTGWLFAILVGWHWWVMVGA